MAPSDSKTAYIARSSMAEGEVEVKLVAKLIISLAIKTRTNTTSLHVSWASQPFVRQTCKVKKRQKWNSSLLCHHATLCCCHSLPLFMYGTIIRNARYTIH